MDQTQWTQVGVIVACLAVLLALTGWLVVNRVDARLSKHERFLHAQQQQFLQGEYARAAAESEFFQEEFGVLIDQVRAIATAVRDAVVDGTWDPDAHLDALDRLDKNLDRVKASPLPPPH